MSELDAVLRDIDEAKAKITYAEKNKDSEMIKSYNALLVELIKDKRQLQGMYDVMYSYNSLTVCVFFLLTSATASTSANQPTCMSSLVCADGL